jgi:uncharacterized DUF497 family protein
MSARRQKPRHAHRHWALAEKIKFPIVETSGKWDTFFQYGITVIPMRFHFDERKSGRLRANPRRGMGFEEVQEVFSHAYYLDQRWDVPEQYRAIGWVGEQLYTVIFEVREDEEGE